MNYPQQSVTVNLGKLKHEQMKVIASELIDNDGVIFGGYVRDTVIHDHYASLFFEKHHDKYDDPTFDPETKHRLLVPKDIDVFCQTGKRGIIEVLEKLKKPDRDVTYRYVTPVYFSEGEIKHLKVTIRFPFIFSLIHKQVSIDLDVLHSKSKVEPPFGKCDMYCNAFLMDKRGIHLSTNTGDMDLDCTSVLDIRRRKMEIDLLDDILVLKSKVIQKLAFNQTMDEFEINHRQRKIGRIINMLSRGWTFTNLSFFDIYRFPHETKPLDQDTSDCKICLEPVPKFKAILKLTCCGITVDSDCLRKYLIGELEERLTPRCINHCSSRTDGWNIFTRSTDF